MGETSQEPVEATIILKKGKTTLTIETRAVDFSWDVVEDDEDYFRNILESAHPRVGSLELSLINPLRDEETGALYTVTVENGEDG